MEDLESITSEVRQCLDDNPRTRDSDNLLYWMIAQDILQKQDIGIVIIIPVQFEMIQPVINFRLLTDD